MAHLDLDFPAPFEDSSADTSDAEPTTELVPTLLRAFSHSDRATLLPAITSAVAVCGGWILERRSRSDVGLEVIFEVQLGSVDELYGTLVGTGLEFSRSGHAALAELCTCRYFLAPVPRRGQIITLRLDIAFFSRVSLEHMQCAGAARA